MVAHPSVGRIRCPLMPVIKKDRDLQVPVGGLTRSIQVIHFNSCFQRDLHHIGEGFLTFFRGGGLPRDQ